MANNRSITSGGSLLNGSPVRISSGELFSAYTAGANTGASARTTARKSSYKSSGGGGGGDVYAAPAVDQTARFQGLLAEMSGKTFTPQTVSYTAATEAELSAQIAGWLLPGYEQAIAERQRLTRGYAAELDADAIARGMGSSTYVTDVKRRQQRDEASDIATLRGEYGATLAKNVSERLSEEKGRALEADMFNAEARQSAYELAYQATVLLMGLGAVAH